MAESDGTHTPQNRAPSEGTGDFRARLDAKTWREIVDVVSTLLTEAHFILSESGLTLCQLDSSKAAMIDLNLPAGVFQEYTCKGEHIVCLAVEDLVRIAKRMNKGDKVEIALNAATQRFEIHIKGKHMERQFRLMLLSPPESRRDSKSIGHEVLVEMDTSAFRQAVQDIGVVAGHIKMEAVEGSLTLIGEGGFGDAMVVLRTGDESPLYNIQVARPTTATYSLSYLTEMVRALPSEALRLKFATDRPIQLESVLADGGNLRFVLAPRVSRVPEGY